MAVRTHTRKPASVPKQEKQNSAPEAHSGTQHFDGFSFSFRRRSTPADSPATNSAVSLARVEDSSRRALFGSLGAALFILSLGGLDAVTRGAIELPALIPPFGASTVIVFFAPDTPASRAWNVTLGHLGSALAAVAVLLLLPEAPTALQGALAVSLAALWMVCSRSIHPPGGATALLSVLGGQRDTFLPMLLPLLGGCLTLVAVRGFLDVGLAWLRADASDAEQADEPGMAQAPDFD